MIIKSAERRPTLRPKSWGGEGELAGKHYLAENAGEGDSPFAMCAEMTLKPGHSIGVHTHDANEEIYILLSGIADYTDETGAVHRLAPGDMTLTRRGQSHGIRNPGQEPLNFLAVIAK